MLEKSSDAVTKTIRQLMYTSDASEASFVVEEKSSEYGQLTIEGYVCRI